MSQAPYDITVIEAAAAQLPRGVNFTRNTPCCKPLQPCLLWYHTAAGAVTLFLQQVLGLGNRYLLPTARCHL
jgi:hypothetical protein